MKKLLIATTISLVSVNTFAGTAADAHTYDRDLDSVYEYTKQVHGYAHGNSLGIQHLERTKVGRDEFVKDQQRQDKHINAVQNAAQAANEKADAGAVRMDGIEGSLANTDNRSINNAVRLDGVEAHNGRQDQSIDALNAQADAISQTINNHGDVLGNHQQQIDHLQSSMGAQVNSAMNRANQAYKEARLAQDMASAALAVSGHQYDTNYNGIQTAVSAASFTSGSAAISVGIGGKLTDRVFLNGAVTSAGSATGGVLSGTYKW